jgi:hypothetical protein
MTTLWNAPSETTPVEQALRVTLCARPHSKTTRPSAGIETGVIDTASGFGPCGPSAFVSRMMKPFTPLPLHGAVVLSILDSSRYLVN